MPASGRGPVDDRRIDKGAPKVVSPPVAHPWRGLAAAIATRHGKADQFGPPLVRHAGLRLRVADVDTDLFGTFTGEIERDGGPVETARRKARSAIDATDAPIGLGSEGSYGPHPDVASLALGIELAVCIHAGTDMEIVERVVSTDTNFGHLDLDRLPIPPEFLHAVGFPAHAVVVSPPDRPAPMFKGLRARDAVDRAAATCLRRSGLVRIQADMRAHLNPTRQRTLVELADRLGRRIASLCPVCAAPGWGVVEIEKGLPCAWCAAPTALVAAEILGCARRACAQRTRVPAPELAPAAMCPMCNP